MCVVSMVADHFNQEWPKNFPWILNPNSNAPTKEEFEELKTEVKILKALLKKAKIYDENSNEPDCEIEEKMAKLREIAKLVGIDLDEVFKKKTQ